MRVSPEFELQPRRRTKRNSRGNAGVFPGRVGGSARERNESRTVLVPTGKKTVVRLGDIARVEASFCGSAPAPSAFVQKRRDRVLAPFGMNHRDRAFSLAAHSNLKRFPRTIYRRVTRKIGIRSLARHSIPPSSASSLRHRVFLT